MMAANKQVIHEPLAILRVIHDLAQKNGYAPTIREIMTATGITTTSVVSYHLEGLEERMLITNRARQARSVQLTAAGRVALGLKQTYVEFLEDRVQKLERENQKLKTQLDQQKHSIKNALRVVG